MDKDRWKPKFNVFFSECREFLRYLEFEIQTKLIFSKQQEDLREITEVHANSKKIEANFR